MKESTIEKMKKIIEENKKMVCSNLSNFHGNFPYYFDKYFLFTFHKKSLRYVYTVFLSVYT
ncbi:hypothetical protein EXQ27_17770 [Clostridium botulinum]|nr:hypothetical protein [Clostridium botulinum]MBO0540304.1 hypothetical protein [Clostridium botulinum]